MKTKDFLISILLVSSFFANGQIKVFDNNWISLGSLQQFGKGIQIDPLGVSYFNPNVYGPYQWMNVSNSTDSEAKNWCVNWNNSHTFFVYGNGWIYGRGHTLGSDSVFKTNIEDIKNPLAKLLQLHGVMFNLKKTANKPDTVRIQDKDGIWHVVSTKNFDNLDTTKFNVNVIKRLVEEREMKHLGVIAQEVEKAVPEVVRMMPDGTLGVEYYSMIGLIIEAIKEQQNLIGNYFQSPAASLKNNETIDSSENEKGNLLYQNFPNPFNKSTVIKYKLSSTGQKSSIMIFDMQGTLLVTYKELDPTGEITILGYQFKPGMYLYSLIVNGKEIDTKRMILTD